jgi:hypothetical protein
MRSQPAVAQHDSLLERQFDAPLASSSSHAFVAHSGCRDYKAYMGVWSLLFPVGVPCRGAGAQFGTTSGNRCSARCQA